MSEMIVAMSVYETHVTVHCPHPAELARLESWAAERELKVTHIVLARGRTASQPMLTLPDRDGHEALVPRLRAAGFDPVRVKVETVPGARQERFVTQRWRGTAAEAGAACDALVAALAGAGYDIRSQEREFVLYDSDLSVDDGWIEEGDGP
ncbi:hypothetical protein [Streptomyces sp. AP-93]|uniref:hypothetical protein n=1 Tax=Streptomyces sp. AP-93 TaxID=2929048 RepID=UPI001FB0404C|nr:hypothetical protein [Streptomyces sp. AP-93]MCJ0870671.1 hypothetical protein [Streptomyces sp. AP-93]